MDDRVKRFFDVIKLDETEYSFFNGSSVKKVDVDKEKKEWTVYLNLENIIPINTFKNMYNLSQNIKDVNKVHFVFDVKNLDYPALLSYNK